LAPGGDFDAVACRSACGASVGALSGAVISAPQRGQRNRCPAWYGGTLTFPPHCGQEIRIDELPCAVTAAMPVAEELGLERRRLSHHDTAQGFATQACRGV
jgi:hypothetical protein